MKYISTRGGGEPQGPAAVALSGIAPDGGLYVPAAWPTLEPAALRRAAEAPYAEGAAKILSLFCGESIDEASLSDHIATAYASFAAPDVTPLREIEENLYQLELYNGPTFSFKDVALQFLGRYLDHLLEASGRRALIVGATSGDTGSAAIHAVAGRPNIDIVMLHPEGRVSEVQRRQMTTVADANVHNVAIAGTFDDCQSIAKTLLLDASLRPAASEPGTGRVVTAVNSINWFRIAAQSVYYLRTAVRLDAGNGVTFVVPSGNFGNAYAGRVAKALGAPVRRIIAATNANDILARVLESGEYRPRGAQATLSPAMDIQVASNFERLLFELSGRDGEAVSALIRQLAEAGAYRLEPAHLAEARALFGAARVDDAGTLAEMRRVHEAHGLILDPHTAIASAVANRIAAEADGPVVFCATAHPAKFPEAVEAAIGIAPPQPEALAALAGLPERCVTLPAEAAAVRAHIEKVVPA